MTSHPALFVSAVSSELKTARKLVADTLRSLDIEVEVQEIFNVPTGDLRGAIREKIDRCHGVIQLVGQRYGFEPPSFEKLFDSYSYTQFEARYAVEKDQPVWFLILDKDFPSDTAEEETAGKRAFQDAWRENIRKSGHVYEGLGELKDVENRALRIAHECNRRFAKPGDDAGLIAEIRAKLDQALAQLPQARAEAVQSSGDADSAAIEQSAYQILEKKLGLPAGVLVTELPRLAEKLLLAPDTSFLDRARALHAEKKYAEAEAEALLAKAYALSPTALSISDAIDALALAGDCARKQICFPRALEHYRAATVLTDPERDPLKWADIQYMLAYVLDDDGHYEEAAEILGKVISTRTRVLGPELPDTLSSRNNLANALDAQGKHAGAVKEHRKVLAIRERVLGTEDSDTLTSRNNLANALHAQGKYAEAEKEHRAVLAIRERVLGPEHPDTLASRNNLAGALHAQGKYAEAEKEHREVLAIRDRVRGAKHPEAFRSSFNLALSLEAQGKYKEALEFAQRARDGYRQVLGADHPDSKMAKELCKHIEAELRKGE